ncbi:MAG TPA: FAD-dependent oxidoreductase [Nitriliruptoraceae bacterium]|nr:FAD-dependent oxidoreductase [Nitriliruptoraceae bacterium]
MASTTAQPNRGSGRDATDRVVVVGGGVEGLSIAHGLARRGVEVVLCERSELASGGTGKSSGVVRAHYGVASLAAMAWIGVQALERGVEELGHDVGFVQTGYVVGVGPDDVAALQANVAMHQGLGVDVELVDHDAVAGQWPGTELDDFAAFAHEPRGGHGDAHSTALAYAHAARRAGATIRPHTPVVALETAGDRVVGVALADGTTVAADLVVVAAGAWSVPLCAQVGVDLPIRAQREQIMLVDPGRDLGEVPVLSDLVSLQYVRAERDGSLLVGNSDHSAPDYVDVDRYRNQVDDAYVERAAAKIQARFPGLDPALKGGYSGCYDVTPDFNPIIDLPGPDGLLVAAGFSGHGYKISPAVGELVADLVIAGASRHPDVVAADFRLDRFALGRPLTSEHPYRQAGQMR